MSETVTPKRSLARKLTLPLVIVGACVAGLGVTGIYAVVSMQQEARLRLRAETIAQSIGYAAENLEREGELQRIVNATSAERETALLLVAGGRERKIIASSNPAWRARTLGLDSTTTRATTELLSRTTLRTIGIDPLTPPAHWLIVSLPLQLHDLKSNSIDLYPAVAVVALDTATSRAEVWRLTFLTAGGFTLTLLALFSLHYLNLRRLVLRPLAEIAQSQLGGAGPPSACSLIDPADEIGQLDAALTTVRVEREHIEFAINQHVIVAVTDPRGRITYANDRFCNVAGYTRDELLGQDHRILNSGQHPREFFADLFRTISQGKVWHGQICNRAKNGELYWVDTSIVPELGSNGKPVRYVALRSEITERKVAEAKLMATNEQLNHAIEQAHQLTQKAEMATIAKADFLANMSHEIRTPMNGVIGMLDLLRSTPLNDEQRKFTEVAYASGESLLTIINDILDFSKIEAGKLDLEAIDLNLDELLAAITPLFALRAQEKSLLFVSSIAPSVPLHLQGDPVRLRQVITNLLSNAFKFTAQGEVHLCVTTERVTPTEVILRFAVTDTGPGIPSETLGLLFNKFSQADVSTTRKHGGTGLGLAICKQLAELMGGEVGVTSHVGQGSTFWFTARLNRQPVTSRPVFKPAPTTFAQSPTGEPLPSAHILVVDDNETNQLVALSLLKKLGYTCATVGSGAEALRALLDHSYDLVLMDVQMPEMDGLEATTRIRAGEAGAGNRSKPIIALTANALTGDRERCVAAGMNDYLMKPIDPMALKTTVARWLVTTAETPLYA